MWRQVVIKTVGPNSSDEGCCGQWLE